MPVVFADHKAAIGEVFRNVPPGESIRAASIYNGQLPRPGTWCGPELIAVDDTTPHASQPRIPPTIVAVASSRDAVVLMHPDTPWEDAVALSYARPGRYPRIKIALDPTAARAPERATVTPTSGLEYDPLVRVVNDGVVVARFDAERRLIHASGTVMATHSEGIVTAGLRDNLGRTEWELFDADALADPELGIHWGNAWDRDGRDPVLTLYGETLGTLEGRPNRIQRAMVRLGFALLDLPELSVAGLALALWDGALVHADDEAARWDDATVRINDEVFDTRALSDMTHVDGMPTLACSAGESSAIVVHMDRHQLSVLGSPERPRPVHAGSLPLYSIDHAQARAVCVAAAVALRNEREPTDNDPLDQWRIAGEYRWGRPHYPIRPRRLPNMQVLSSVGMLLDEPMTCTATALVDTRGRVISVEFPDCPRLVWQSVQDAVHGQLFYPPRNPGVRPVRRYTYRFHFRP